MLSPRILAPCYASSLGVWSSSWKVMYKGFVILQTILFAKMLSSHFIRWRLIPKRWSVHKPCVGYEPLRQVLVHSALLILPKPFPFTGNIMETPVKLFRVTPSWCALFFPGYPYSHGYIANVYNVGAGWASATFLQNPGSRMHFKSV